jgi:tetratricopeptide (TPR) repeat protein
MAVAPAFGVFISYRRGEAAGYAGRLHDSLVGRVDGRVFMDINSINPGTDFHQAIDDALRQCRVMLALIGPRWLDVATEEGSRRLDDPEDFVRQELEAAFDRSLVVIPVLVGDASMPQEAHLPASLARLSRCQALELSDRLWHESVSELINAITPLGDDDIVDEASARAVRVPFPTALVYHDVFVGRDTALIELDQAWHAIDKSNQPVGVLIAGEPGIGKTRLVSEFAARIQSDRALVLLGRCDEELGVAFQPFTEALCQYIGAVSSEYLKAIVPRDVLTVLSRVVPHLRDLVSGLGTVRQADAETERYELFEAVRAFLAAVSAKTPLLLVVEDLHWAAKPTLLPLRHILRTSEPMSVLIVATYRDTELGGERVLADALADLRTRFGVAQITLGGLTAEDVHEWLHASAPTSDEDTTIARQFWRETDGLPLFLHEMLRQVGDVDAASRLSTALREVPPRVQDLIDRRVARLSPSAQSLLVTASVVGTSTSVDFLERVEGVGVTEEALLDAIDETITSGVLREVADTNGGLVFTHALMREVVYAKLSGPRRARLHRRVAQTLEALGPVSGNDDRVMALAHHYSHSGSAAATDAADYALLAGRQLTQRLAFEEALVHLTRGLEVLDKANVIDRNRRADLLLALGEIHRLSSLDEMKKLAERAADEARASGSTERLARAAVLRSGTSDIAHSDPAAFELCREALDAIGEEHLRLRAQLLAVVAFHQAWGDRRGGAARPVAEEALRLARADGDHETLFITLATLILTLLPSADVDERLQLADELVRSAEGAGDTHWYTVGLQLRASARLVAGDVTGFDADMSRLDRACEKMAGYTRAYGAMWRALRALIDGCFDAAETYAGDMLAFGEQSLDFMNMYAGQLLLIRREQGRLEELLPLVQQAVLANPDMDAFRAGFALVCCDLQQIPEARESFDRLASNDFALPRDALWSASIALSSEVCAALGDRDRASLLYGLLRPHADHLIVVAVGSVCLGAADRYLGMLATTLERWTDAEAHFRVALTLEHRLGSRPLLARTRLAYAGMLRGRNAAGDALRASELLTTAHADAEALRMPRVVEAIRALNAQP